MRYSGPKRVSKLLYGDLNGTFTPMAREGWEHASNITNQFSRWTAVYLLGGKFKTLALL